MNTKKFSGMLQEQIDVWELPILAARLREWISEDERSLLLHGIRELLQRLWAIYRASSSCFLAYKNYNRMIFQYYYVKSSSVGRSDQSCVRNLFLVNTAITFLSGLLKITSTSISPFSQRTGNANFSSSMENSAFTPSLFLRASNLIHLLYLSIYTPFKPWYT